MKNKTILALVGLSIMVSATSALSASDMEKRRALSKKIKQMAVIKSKIPHAPPASVGGINFFPKKGAFVAGIKHKNINKSGLIQGSDSISNAAATHPATGFSNEYFGQPMQPKTLRVVPISAEAKVFLPFINYTLNDTTSLVATLPLINKEVKLETFNPPGTASIGTNTVRSKGMGDLKVGAIHRIYRSSDKKHNWLINAILSIPTGSITEEDMVLQPNGAMAKKRLAYGMQLGSGTYDAILGLVYWGKEKKLGWGAKIASITPLQSENDEGWSFADKQTFTVWGSYVLNKAVTATGTINHETQGTLEGRDPKIKGASLGAQTGDYGGTLTELSIGLNWKYSKGHSIGIDYATPISQDRNGLQLTKDSALTLSWNNAFF